jgi:diguanylate cyclase (GGDEF)-like protein
MNVIDPRTVILLTGLMSGLMSIVLYALKRTYPPSIKGVGDWAGALATLFVAGVLVSGRGTFADMVAISLSTLLFWLGLYWAYVGTQRFFGLSVRPWPWIALIAGFLLAHMWFALVEPDYSWRMIFSTTMSALLTLAHARLFFLHGPMTLAKGITGTVLLGMAMIQLIRLATASSVGLGSEFFSADSIQLIYIMSFAFTILLASVSMVLLATERLRTELQHLASRDSLTHAYTRRHINHSCQRELERSQRHQRSMAVLLIDLDHFKAINDTYGHQGGDTVLVNLVTQINALLRQHDELGRMGGEEFLVLLPEASQTEAIGVAERIRETCALAHTGPHCTASIGIAVNEPGDTVDFILARADAALYRAKANGRNRVEVA